MKNIYEESIHAIGKGVPYSINIKKRNFSLNHRPIIKDGEYREPLELGIPVFDCLEETLEHIDKLYTAYYRSVPGERGSRSHHSFQAVDLEELDDYEMVTNESRQLARAKLELFILLAIISGQLVWDDKVMGGTFFRQIKQDDTLQHFILTKDLFI